MLVRKVPLCTICGSLIIEKNRSNLVSLARSMPKIYLASPLGFSSELKPCLERTKARLVQLGYEVFDPWAQPFSKAIREASKIEDYHDRTLPALGRPEPEVCESWQNWPGCTENGAGRPKPRNWKTVQKRFGSHH